jgi:hypothetical protein
MDGLEWNGVPGYWRFWEEGRYHTSVDTFVPKKTGCFGAVRFLYSCLYIAFLSRVVGREQLGPTFSFIGVQHVAVLTAQNGLCPS